MSAKQDSLTEHTHAKYITRKCSRSGLQLLSTAASGVEGPAGMLNSRCPHLKQTGSAVRVVGAHCERSMRFFSAVIAACGVLEFHLNHAIAAADWFDACSLFTPPVTDIKRLRAADLVYVGDNRLTPAHQ